MLSMNKACHLVSLLTSDGNHLSFNGGLPAFSAGSSGSFLFDVFSFRAGCNGIEVNALSTVANSCPTVSHETLQQMH